MKKITFVLAMLLCFATSMKAQTYVGDLPCNGELEGYIPGRFSLSGHPYLVYFDDENDKISIYQSDFVTHYMDIDENDINPRWIDYFDLDLMSNESELLFTQNLFNDDEFFEYFELEKDYITYYDTSYWYDPYLDTTYMEIEEWSTSITKAINIKSTNGNTIWSFNNEEGNYCYLEGIIKLDNKYYLLIETENEFDYKINVYLIKNSQGLTKVETPLPLKAFPTMPRRDEQITVELGEETNAREIAVVNSLGQELKRIPISKGQRTVTIPARDLGHGLNVLNARGDRNQGSCKIIVR